MDGHNKRHYIPGDLLWVKVGKFPYWPCMVSYDPSNGYYYKRKEGKKGVTKMYHVQYFGKAVAHGWTLHCPMLPFEGKDKFLEKREVTLNDTVSQSMKKRLNRKYNVPSSIENEWLVAAKEADYAYEYETSMRYKCFVFKYDKEYKKNTEASSSSVKRRRKKHKKVKSKESKKLSALAIQEASDVVEELCKMCTRGNVDLPCRGTCLNFFHKSCLGIVNAPDDFKCLDCDKDYFTCFICKAAGMFAVQCIKCPYYYHPGCVERFECADFDRDICPRHVCFTCHKRNPRNISAKGPFVQCFRCPTMFHATVNCIPVGSQKLSPDLILCPEHFLGKLRKTIQTLVNVPYCVRCGEGGVLACCESCPNSYHYPCIDGDTPIGDFYCSDCTGRNYLYVGMIAWVKSGGYRWWPAQIANPNNLPPNVKAMPKFPGEFPVQFYGTDEYFYAYTGRAIPYTEQHKTFKFADASHFTSKSLKEQYQISLEEAAAAFDEYVEQQNKVPNEKPDRFKHIKVNRAVPPAIIITEKQTPCSCDPSEPNPCSTDMCLNRSMLMECGLSSCNANDLCENQRFQRRQYARVKVVKTQNRGWGLASQEPISKGSFIIEYVGEVITHKEYEKRCDQMRQENIKNYYFLYIDASRLIDAGPKGNLARFINHSCNPNCEMVKWSVNGDVRIGIFSLTDIKIGAELTFDYQADTIEFEQKCFCGAQNCQGIIGKKQNGAKQNGAKQNGAKQNGAKQNGAKQNGAKLNGAKPYKAKLNGVKPNGAKLNGAKHNIVKQTKRQNKKKIRKVNNKEVKEQQKLPSL